ncbi:hypothetical protein [Alcanivorax nanhaiticus]|uniref:hypothetical protein n=1 Tax=Alcanivorax nanhaiticus TaxID=1177154 RepID=UPI0012E05AA2|nr:hypothetical protein [Alcanivorax nanhaiticus]
MENQFGHERSHWETSASVRRTFIIVNVTKRSKMILSFILGCFSSLQAIPAYVFTHCLDIRSLLPPTLCDKAEKVRKDEKQAGS